MTSKLSNLRIETDRLILRPFTMDDIDGAYTMNLDEEVSRYTGDGGVVSREEMERRIVHDVLGDYEKHGFGRLAVELKDTGDFIGFAGLKFLEDLEEVDDLGFNRLGIKKIVAMVLPENEASVHILEKLKFQYEKDIQEDGLTARLYALES